MRPSTRTGGSPRRRSGSASSQVSLRFILIVLTNSLPATPLGQLPILEVKGRTIAQSFTIARYLARQHGLAGNNDLAAAEADVVIDSLVELLGPMADMMREKDEQKKAEKRKVFTEETLPGWLEVMEKLLMERGGKHFAGGELSWADLAVFNLIDDMKGRLGEVKMEQYPGLDQLTLMVKGLPNIAKWLEERPVTPF